VLQNYCTQPVRCGRAHEPGRVRMDFDF